MKYTTRYIVACLHIALALSHFVVGCESYTIQPKIWEYKSKHDIGYEVAKRINKTTQEHNSKEPILLLNGFGVGSFHQHRLIPEILKDGTRASTVYCMDYLGQGRSWPKECQDGQGENEENLQYSANMWCEQIIDFIERVIIPAEEKERPTGIIDGKPLKVHVVGNSVGGHLAAYVAMLRPDLISSICLLNPTPVWGSKLPGWNGHLPAPTIPKAVGRYLFDRIRDLKTIEQFLEATYSRRASFSDDLMHQIRGCTLGNGGHAAFASIMWSPPLNPNDDGSMGDFQDCLRRVPCDVCLVFGKDDPWCKPAFAKKMIRALEERTIENAVHRYIEITNAGHCPNHEAPKAVGHLVSTWVGAKDGDRRKGYLSFIESNRQQRSFVEEWGSHDVIELERDDIELGWIDRLVTSFM